MTNKETMLDFIEKIKKIGNEILLQEARRLSILKSYFPPEAHDFIVGIPQKKQVAKNVKLPLPNELEGMNFEIKERNLILNYFSFYPTVDVYRTLVAKIHSEANKKQEFFSIINEGKHPITWNDGKSKLIVEPNSFGLIYKSEIYGHFYVYSVLDGKIDNLNQIMDNLLIQCYKNFGIGIFPEDTNKYSDDLVSRMEEYSSKIRDVMATGKISLSDFCKIKKLLSIENSPKDLKELQMLAETLEAEEKNRENENDQK